MAEFVAAICYRRKFSPVISDRERGTDFHGALCSVNFLRCFGLFRKMNGSFVSIVRDEVRRFFEAHPAQCAARVHIPLAGRILRLLAQFVRHDLNKRKKGDRFSTSSTSNARSPSRAALFPRRFRSQRNRKIHLPFKDVDASDEDG
jgi:hypothetical protein